MTPDHLHGVLAMAAMRREHADAQTDFQPTHGRAECHSNGPADAERNYHLIPWVRMDPWIP